MYQRTPDDDDAPNPDRDVAPRSAAEREIQALQARTLSSWSIDALRETLNGCRGLTNKPALTRGCESELRRRGVRV